jgi:uncharacterized protein YndB with AHSA1/START domain
MTPSSSKKIEAEAGRTRETAGEAGPARGIASEAEAGRTRRIEVEVEVPGTPEEVWKAIATGPGIAAWFVPAEIEPRAGGAISFDHGPGIDAPRGTVTAWDRPHRFAYEEPWEGETRLGTEFLVEARAGGTCTVRLVSSLFGATQDWDAELDQMDEGWHGFLANLRLYLTHFPGQRASLITATGNAPTSHDRAWADLRAALGLELDGDRAATTAPGVPALAGTIELRLHGAHHGGLMLRTDEPAPGTAFVFTFSYEDRAYTKLQAYLFGAGADAIAARDEPAWRAWMADHFPA